MGSTPKERRVAVGALFECCPRALGSFVVNRNFRDRFGRIISSQTNADIRCSLFDSVRRRNRGSGPLTGAGVFMIR